MPLALLAPGIARILHIRRSRIGSPIEIQIWPDKIEILSYPGPVPPVDAQILRNEERIVAREYRNRRIGDFLKELHLTEGRGTGFPTIYKAMRNNGSPDPVFKTDDHSTYFLTTLSAIVSNQVKMLVFNDLGSIVTYTNEVSDQVSNEVSNETRDQASSIINIAVHEKVMDILNFVQNYTKSKEIMEGIGLTNQTKNRKKNTLTHYLNMVGSEC